MIKTSITLQDLRMKIYIKAKAEREWRFWGLYFSYIKQWVEKKLRRHLMRARKRKGFGWNRWSRRELYEMGLYSDYQIRYYSPLKAAPAR
jgi:hypothetical protein